MGPRIHLRYRSARPQRDAFRGARMSDAEAPVATPSQTVGPFFHFALTAEARSQMAGPLDGDRIQLLIAVTDGDGCAVPDAVIELWQPGGAVSAFGRMPTGEDGVCAFETVRPARSADASGPPQAPHINVCLFARGLLRQL